MRKKPTQKKSSRSSLKLLFLFCAVVFMAIGLSLGYRLFNLIRESKYDTKHSFLITFIYRNDIDIVEISSDKKTFSHLEVRGGKNATDAQQEVGIITDTHFTLSEPFSLTHLSRYFTDAVLPKRSVKSTLNIFDLYRLSFATKGISQQSITSQKVHVPLDQDLSSTMLEQLFLDETIDQENKSVSIINGTGVPGLGTRLERALTSLGVSVISVKNADSVKSSSTISYSGEKTYTLDRIKDLLPFSVTPTSNQPISDIIILIGKDMSQTTRF